MDFVTSVEWKQQKHTEKQKVAEEPKWARLIFMNPGVLNTGVLGNYLFNLLLINSSTTLGSASVVVSPN